MEARSFRSFAVASGSARGFGVPQAYFGIETLMDQAAAKLDMDPIELRRLNVLKKGDRRGFRRSSSTSIPGSSTNSDGLAPATDTSRYRDKACGS